MRHLHFLALVLAPSLAMAAQDAAPDGNLSSNVIGAREAPTVLNVVPWKSKEVKLEKKDVTSSLLDRALEPLDRDVLMREVEYYRMLNEHAARSDATASP